MKASVTLARLVLAAIDAREKSFDHVASQAAQDAADREREAEPDNLYAGLVEHAQFYGMNMLQASESVCVGENAELTEPVYFLISAMWNDAQEWAERVLAANAS